MTGAAELRFGAEVGAIRYIVLRARKKAAEAVRSMRELPGEV
jgi:hypothetical protein